MAATILHLLVGLLGLALLCAALFLHETEEGQLQNRLEQLWVEIDDLSKTALSKQAAFLQRVSAMANSALDKLFGIRLFSAGAIAASLCFSMGSTMVLTLVAMHLVGRRASFEPYVVGVGIVSILIALLPNPWRYLGFPWISLLLWAMTLSDVWRRSASKVSLRLSVIFVGGFFSTVLFIALSRWCLRKGAELKNGWKIAALVTLNGCVGLALISPLLLGIVVEMYGKHIRGETFETLVSLASANGVTGVIALLFLVLSLLALAHLALWPFLQRPLYSLQRFGVARNPKLLAGVSLTCLLFAWPNSPIIQLITKLIHGG